MRILADYDMDEATITATVPAAISADDPVRNITTEYRQQVMRTVGTGDVTLRVDFGAAKICTGLCLATTDIAPTATITVMGWADNYVTQVTAQDFHAAPAINPWGVLPWGVFDWGGTPTAADLLIAPASVLVFWFGGAMARRWSVRINNGVTPFYLGRMLLGLAWRSTYEINRDDEIALGDGTEISYTPGGVAQANASAKYDLPSVNLWITETERNEALPRIWRAAGLGRAMAVELFSDDDWPPRKRFMHTYLARFAEPPRYGTDGPSWSLANMRFRSAV